MKHSIYPGSFDPFTNGHLDILTRAARLFDTVTVGVLENASKTPFFSTQERLEMIEEIVAAAGLEGVRVEAFDGLTIEFARARGAQAIIRGLRAVSDYEYELQLASLNKTLAPEIETVFFMADSNNAYLSSSIVKEIGRYGGDISAFVPPVAHQKIVERLQAK